MNNSIKRLRQHLGLSQAAFAGKISSHGKREIGQTSISNYENGRPPEFGIGRQILKLAKESRYRMTYDDIYPPDDAVA